MASTSLDMALVMKTDHSLPPTERIGKMLEEASNVHRLPMPSYLLILDMASQLVVYLLGLTHFLINSFKWMLEIGD